MLRLALLLLLVCTGMSAGAAQAEPVTVRHAFGISTVPSPPKRIVVVGLHEQDFLYALGIAPVGVHEWFGERPYATWPWAEPARQALKATPEVQRGFDIDLEWVWHLHPDLILATYSAMDGDDYAKLSRIAPVIGPPEDYPAWGAPWQAEMRLIAAATNHSLQGEAVIAGLEKTMDTLRGQYPGLSGRSAAVVYVAQNRLTGYPAQDATSRFLSSLGLVIPTEYSDLAGDAGQFTVSLEQIRLFDRDAVLWLSDPAGRTMIEHQPVYRATRMARENRAVWADEEELAALSFQTPLSISWVAHRIAPRLAQAVAGEKTGTEAPAIVN